jgi:hypothetical protein
MDPSVSNLSDDASSVPVTWDTVSQKYNISGAIGITLLLGKIITTLSKLIDPQTQANNNVKFFLNLLNIALEAGGPSLGTMLFVVEVLRGDICRHLLKTSQSTDLAIFNFVLRVVFNLFMSIKDHMKVQLEVFLTSVHLRILHPSNLVTSTTPSEMITLSQAREELALESLLEFCREPSLMHDIYTNYDCDVQCTNLFDSIISTLCSRASPSGSIDGLEKVHDNNANANGANGQVTQVNMIMPRVNILNRLSLEGVLIILHAVAVRCNYVLQVTSQRNANTKGLEMDKMKHISNLSDRVSLMNLPSSSMTSLSDIDGLTSGMDAEKSGEFVNKTLSDVDKWCMEEGDVDLWPPNDDRELKLGSNESPVHGDDNSGIVNPMDPITTRTKTAELLRERKIKKQRMRLCAEKFNEKPFSHDWVRFASDLSLLPKIQVGCVATSGGAGEGICDAKSIALFLKNTPGLSKALVGEYLSKGPPDKYPFYSKVLLEYVKTFEFSSKTSFVDALRKFLGHFRLPGEAQCIDRLMEAFAGHLFDHLGMNNPFVNADAAFILAFSTIMLNTDLHNTGIPKNKKMKKEEFIRNNRGINGGADLPKEYLENLYDEIKDNQIQVDHTVADGVSIPLDYSDDISWNKLLHKGWADQVPASFTPTIAARRGASGEDIDSRYLNLFPPSAHEKDMFLVMEKQVIVI